MVDADGTIITNAHVVGSSKDVSVRFDEDDDPVPAQVLGVDGSTDIAVLKIDPEAAGGRSSRSPSPRRAPPTSGDPALAIGNPFGLERTATAGIVSAVGRQIEAPNGFSISDAIQTDAPINPGNSGGPLLDAQGEVLGVNSQILTGGAQGNVGIGFAVPSMTVAKVLPDLKAGRKIRRPYLGVQSAPPMKGDGAEIADVVAGGPAAKAGLRRGDVIRKIAGTVIEDPEAVGAAIEERKPGEAVTLTVDRGGKQTAIKVTLGTRPSAVR